MTRVWPVLLLLALCLLSGRAHSQTLPDGITCEQVVHYAGEFNIPNTMVGRLRAKVIAAALGVYLTDRQLDAAAKCLRLYKADQRMGCKHDPDTWECLCTFKNGDCK